MKFLLAIYEQEKDWNKAIAVLRRMDAVTDESRDRDIANYYCELATTEITGSRSDAARPLLEEALSVNNNCVRANILLGDIAMAGGNVEDAITFWTRIEQQDPEYLSLVSEKIFNAYRQTSRSEEGARDWCVDTCPGIRRSIC